MDIILASASPRRKELLHHIFDSFRIITSDCEENALFQTPQQYVMDLSKQKAMDVKIKCENQTFKNNYLIIGADTIVFQNGSVLEKPKTADLAYSMLKNLSNQEHVVFTGVTWVLCDTTHHIIKIDSFSTNTKVFVDTLTEDEIQSYIQSKEPFDKAGGYGIQGLFSKHIKKIDGDYFNVVGLPVHDLYTSLKKKGILL